MHSSDHNDDSDYEITNHRQAAVVGLALAIIDPNDRRAREALHLAEVLAVDLSPWELEEAKCAALELVDELNGEMPQDNFRN